MAERNFTLKTVEEFIDEIKGSESLQNEIRSIKNDDELAAFLKKYDCGASVKEYADYITALSEGEIGDDEAENVAGGLSHGGPTGRVAQQYVDYLLSVHK